MGGAAASRLLVRLGARAGLRLIPLAALPAAGILLFVAVNANSAHLAISLLTACYFLIELTEGCYWTAAMMIGRGNAMAVSGVLNTGGSLGGVVGIPIVAFLSGRGDWTTAFLLGTIFAVISALAWLVIDPNHRLSGVEKAKLSPSSRLG